MNSMLIAAIICMAYLIGVIVGYLIGSKDET